MVASSSSRLMTADEFFCVPDDGKLYELVEGRLEEVPGASPRSSAVAAAIIGLLWNVVHPRRLGVVGGADWAARLFADPDTVRVPDVVFVRRERLPGGRAPVRFQEGVPDLVVEVLSASDRYRRTARKVREYLEAGAQIVLVVDPEDRSGVAHRADGTLEEFDADGVIDLSAAVPGFTLNLAEIWEDGGAES